MDVRDAEDLLAEGEVVALVNGSMSYVKELMYKCLDSEIPATIGRPPGSGKS